MDEPNVTFEDKIEESLKPCPRCGRSPVMEGRDEIHCFTCGFWTGDEMDSLDEAVEWWNYQPLVDKLRARIVELEAQLAEASE